ncbi:MAG TPA: VWA domain-containing protein [Thermoanaerobaculia bacterium]|nr:VWA domain-containing protein [Thermoanaerobaculia bacterium]
MTRRLAAVVSVLLLLTAPVDTALRAQIPALGETMEIHIVNVDVIVTDGDGKRVRGLTREAFDILEDGKLQPLSHFAEYRGSSIATALTPEAAETLGEKPLDQPSQRRTMVIFIEMFKLPAFRVDPFIASVKDLVRSSIRSGDAVSIVTFDRIANVRVSSTSDVSVVERHLDDIGRECTGPVTDRIAMVAAEAREVRAFEAEGAAMLAARGINSTRTSEDDIAIHAARIHTVEARVEMNRRVATINTLLHGLAGIEGKKMLLLASHRLGEYVGAEYFYAAGISNANIPPQERAELDNRQAVRSIIANANASGVTVYPVFPTGLDYTPTDPLTPDISRSVLLNEMVMLKEIADKTGGVSSYGTANTASLMPRVAEDLSDYYSLAYRATARNEDAARKIVVRMKDRKLTVRARREFVEKTDDTRMRDRVLAALHDASLESSFQLGAELGKPMKVSRKTQTAPLKIRIPIKALTLLPQANKHSGAFTVYAITGGKLGDVSEVTRRTQTFDIPAADLDRALAGHFTYNFDVILDDKTKQLAVGVLDEISKTYGLLTVPVSTQ